MVYSYQVLYGEGREIACMITREELEQVAPLDTLLVSLGLTKLRDRGAYFSCSSPFRHDEHPSFCIYKDSLRCKDFASGYSSHLFKFIKDLTGQNFNEYVGLESKDFASLVFLSKGKKSEKMRGEFPVIGEWKMRIEGSIDRDIYKYPDVVAYLDRRGINQEFAEFFKFGYTDISYIEYAPVHILEQNKGKKTPFRNRLCIPIYENKEMISIEGRALNPEDVPKVLYPLRANVSTLFNIDNLNRNEPLVVVEGIMDTVLIWQYITKNVTCTFGVNMKPEQKVLLNTFDKVVFCPDADEAGESVIDSAEDFMEKEYYVARLQTEDSDPNSVSVDELKQILSNPVSSIDYQLNKSQLFEEKREISFWQ